MNRKTSELALAPAQDIKYNASVKVLDPNETSPINRDKRVAIPQFRRLIKCSSYADLRDLNGYDATGLNEMGSNLQTLINQIVAAGGGTLEVPYTNNTYKIGLPLQESPTTDDPLPTPDRYQIGMPLITASEKMVHITIQGSTRPNFSTEGFAGAPRNTQGVIFESTILPGVKGFVFGSPYQNTVSPGKKNYLNVSFKNLIVRTRTMTGNTHVEGHLGGINFQRLTNFFTDDVKVDISSPLVDCIEPSSSYDTQGVVFPTTANKAESYARGTLFAEGFRYGININEHFHADVLVAGGCVNGLYIGNGFNKAVYISRYLAECNRNQIFIDGNLRVSMPCYDTEHYVPNGGSLPAKWYAFEKDIIVNNSGTPGLIGCSSVLNSGDNGAPVFVQGAAGWKVLMGNGSNVTL